MGDVGVEDETIAVGDEVKKTLQSTTREKEGGGERYSGGEGVSTQATRARLSCSSAVAVGGGRR